MVLQYNLSAHNAGGFCEILGNNYNCAYRYNVSVNDGHRIKGVNGAFQEGKIFWLSGYQGMQNPRKGPVNSYFYNNTIYVSDSLVGRIAIDNRSRGVLIANNIFHVPGGIIVVPGDQYKPDGQEQMEVKDVFFRQNIFVAGAQWPAGAALAPQEVPIVGDVRFRNPGGLNIADYTPENRELASQGIPIPFIPNDYIGLMQGLHPATDILGNLLKGVPSVGAVQVNAG